MGFNQVFGHIAVWVCLCVCVYLQYVCVCVCVLSIVITIKSSSLLSSPNFAPLTIQRNEGLTDPRKSLWAHTDVIGNISQQNWDASGAVIQKWYSVRPSSEYRHSSHVLEWKHRSDGRDGLLLRDCEKMNALRWLSGQNAISWISGGLAAKRVKWARPTYSKMIRLYI